MAKIWHLVVKDDNSNTEILRHALIARPNIVFDTLVCPISHVPNDFKATLSLENAIEKHATILARFPEVKLSSAAGNDDFGTHKLKQYEESGIRLVVEYQRNRVGDSRRSHDDNIWRVYGITIEFVACPPILTAIAKHLEHCYVHGLLQKERASVSEQIDKNMAEEQQLKLALLDVKCNLAELRKELIQLEKQLITSHETYDHTLNDITTSSSMITNNLS